MEALKFVVGEKRDILCVLPTGYGKSLVYQLLPDIFDAYDNKATSTSIVIVISPLNFLMEEQVNKLNARGISAMFVRASKIFSEESGEECVGLEFGANQSLDELKSGKL